MRDRRAGNLDPWLILGAALLTSSSIVFQFPSGLRILVLLGFLLLCPGLAVIGVLGLDTGSVGGRLALMLGLSVALDTLVPTALIYAGLWSPAASLGALMAISLAGAVFLLVRRLLAQSRAFAVRRRETLGGGGSAVRSGLTLERPDRRRVDVGSRRVRGVGPGAARPVVAARPSAREGAFGPDLLVGLVTGMVLLAWAYPVALIVDHPWTALAAMAFGLLGGMCLRSWRRLPLRVAGTVIALGMGLAALAVLSFDASASFMAQAVADATNVGGPGLFGVALGLVSKAVAGQVREQLRLKKTALPIPSAQDRPMSDDRGTQSGQRKPVTNDSPPGGASRSTRWDGSVRAG